MSDNTKPTVTMRLPDSYESSIYRYPPTIRCLICDKLENPNADIVDTGKVWLCPECKRKLREMMEVSEDA